MGKTEKCVVFFTMVMVDGWKRVGNAYRSRESARGWIPFVSGAWRGRSVKVSRCTLHLVDGVPDAASLRKLDTKYNLDAPAKATP